MKVIIKLFYELRVKCTAEAEAGAGSPRVGDAVPSAVHAALRALTQGISAAAYVRNSMKRSLGFRKFIAPLCSRVIAAQE